MKNVKKVYIVMENDGEMYYILAKKVENRVSLVKKEHKIDLYEPFGTTLLVDSKNSTIEDEMAYYMTHCNRSIVDFKEIFVENMEDVM